MGLYDTVNYSGDKLECAKGHKLNGLELQTKNLGCTMSGWSLTDEELVLLYRGDWWDAELEILPSEPWALILTGRCPHCEEDKTDFTHCVIFYAQFSGNSLLKVERDDSPLAILFC